MQQYLEAAEYVFATACDMCNLAQETIAQGQSTEAIQSIARFLRGNRWDEHKAVGRVCWEQEEVEFQTNGLQGNAYFPQDIKIVLISQDQLTRRNFCAYPGNKLNLWAEFRDGTHEYMSVFTFIAPKLLFGLKWEYADNLQHARFSTERIIFC